MRSGKLRIGKGFFRTVVVKPVLAETNIYSAQVSVVLTERARSYAFANVTHVRALAEQISAPIKPTRSSSETSLRRVYVVTQMLGRVPLLNRKQRPGCFAQLL